MTAGVALHLQVEGLGRYRDRPDFARLGRHGVSPRRVLGYAVATLGDVGVSIRCSNASWLLPVGVGLSHSAKECHVS